MTIRDAVLGACRFSSFAADEPVYRSDDAWTGIYGLASGSVLVQIPCRDGVMRAGHVFRPGSWFGMKPHRGKGRVMTLTALDETHVFLMPAIAVEEIRATAPEIGDSLAQLDLYRTRTSMQAAFDLILRRADLRVAAALLRIEGSEAMPGDMPDPGFFSVAQKHLAEMANVSTMVTNQTLRFMEQAGWIAQRYNRLAIVDPESIAAFIAGEKQLEPVRPQRRRVGGDAARAAAARKAKRRTPGP